MPTEEDRMGDVQTLSVNHYLVLGSIWLLMGGMLTTAHAQLNTSTHIETYMERQINRHSLPGAAVAAIEDGNLIHLAGYGDLKPDTPVYIASLSKSFTALAVMQLVEAGQLDLDAPPVTTYLPGFTTADPTHTAQNALRAYRLSGFVCSFGYFIRFSSVRTKTLPPGRAFFYFNYNRYTTRSQSGIVEIELDGCATLRFTL